MNDLEGALESVIKELRIRKFKQDTRVHGLRLAILAELEIDEESRRTLRGEGVSVWEVEHGKGLIVYGRTLREALVKAGVIEEE